ncbi:LLM class flavin-dependent oxidoreductase [Streptomyces sp. N50]|uniref:LLM class flavin-dependent oxidoreductase n=1 Tax=Streptomyces sp. N50 TaxID=3081765 RepID=UPI00296212CC|nr:LLM class flavin-dependent oxidoreductase [Streptomyces sp. N50]WOX17107.1 LLM class flavin-dependent oxidoreductase [Streptomyces sp. N50]
MAGVRFDVYGTAVTQRTERGDTLQAIVELAQRAERHGVDGLLTFYNHQSIDPWIVASVILQNSKSVTPLVALQPYALPPATAAKLIHSLTRLHRHRIDINLVTGAAEGELSQVGEQLDHDDRYDRAVEYSVVLRSLLSSDEPLFHEGRFYRYRALRINARLEPDERPRIFVAGSSPASRQAAAAVGDVAVTHPEPLAQFAKTFSRREQGGPRTAIRVGLVARPDGDEAWSAARALYPADRLAQIKTSMRKHSESDWSRRLANLASEDTTYDGVYWTGAYRGGGSVPLLVGGYHDVADYLEQYLKLGVTTVLLGGRLASEDDFRHAAAVLSELRGRE